jgi:Na+-translocating ferredoxin:NAD+ oxidoreductase RNF subunit RnfB
METLVRTHTRGKLRKVHKLVGPEEVSNDTFHLHNVILTRESTSLFHLVFIDEDSCIGCTQVSACDTVLSSE